MLILLPQAGVRHYRERHKHSLLLGWTKVSLVQWLIAIGHIVVVSMLLQSSLKLFPLTQVQVFLNSGPILTVLLSGLLLKDEHLTCSILVRTVLAFLGVIIITSGAKDVSTDIGTTS